MKKPVKKMDGGMMNKPIVSMGGAKKIGRRDEGNDEMRRGIPNRPKGADVSLPYMPQKPAKPNMGKPDVTLPYMPQNPAPKPMMPLRRAKGGVAKKMTKGMKKK